MQNKAETFTVTDAMATIGFQNITIVWPNTSQQTLAQRVSDQLFSNDFASCLLKTNSDIDDDFDTLKNLTDVQGKVSTDARSRRMVKAFNQMVKSEIRCGRDPSLKPFDPALTAILNNQANVHEKFVKDAKNAIKPRDLLVDTPWEDWRPTLKNYLSKLPGQYGVPLDAIIRDNDEQQTPPPGASIMEEYASQCVFQGDGYTMDNSTVYTIIHNLIVKRFLKCRSV